MPYLTPEDFGEGDTCRPLLIPATPEWLAIFSGALTELQKPYNWEAFGSLSIEDCLERVQSIIDGYYNDECASEEPCDPCETPGGGTIFRLNVGGHIEQLIAGEWVPPEGDYELPEPAEREESTSDERRCLAAANAASVLEALYEDLSDSFNESLDLAEAGTGFGLILAAKIGIPFGLITAALIGTATAIFGGIYAALEFVGADVWTSDFTDDLRCMLYNCATDTAGVVTFDLECFFDQLWTATDIFDITFYEQRLFYQISVIMQFIGVEGLNVAGGTTEIEEADCSDCVLTLDLVPSTVDPAPGTTITYQGDGNWLIEGYFNGSDNRAGFKDANGLCINIDYVASANNAYFSRYDCASNFASGGGTLTGGNFLYYCGTRNAGTGQVVFNFHAFASEP